MCLPWQQEKVYLSNFGLKTSPIYFQEKSQFEEKIVVVSELLPKNLKGRGVKNTLLGLNRDKGWYETSLHGLKITNKNRPYSLPS